jgi:hypothetical protein
MNPTADLLSVAAWERQRVVCIKYQLISREALNKSPDLR